MRIRATKPEFWQSEFTSSLPACERLLMRDHLPRLVFSGPVGNSKHWRALEYRPQPAPLGGFYGFIYHLFDAAGDPLYFGKTDYPSRRFVFHARKAWWADVTHLNLYIVSCETHPNEQCRGWGSNPRSVITRTTMLWERKAILDVQPRCNIAGVA